MQTRVFVCDDHPIIHRGVSACLSKDAAIAVVGSGCWSAETMECAARSAPDVIIFDLHQAKDGKSHLRKLHAACPKAKLLIFTGGSQLDDMVHALEAGAAGLITKWGDPEHIVAAIQRLMRGDNYLEPGVAMQVIDALRNSEAREVDLMKLSFREEQVLKCLLKGSTNGQIAESLSISEKTVKYYVGCLKDKFNAANRLEIVLTAQNAPLHKVGAMKILIVDDDATNRLVVRLLMGLRGFDVIEAVSANAASAILKTECVDVIFMDIQMPEIDGYEATEALRRDQRLRDVPVLALTSHTGDDVRRRCMDSGMNGFLRKPFDSNLAADVSVVIAQNCQRRSGGEVGWILG